MNSLVFNPQIIMEHTTFWTFLEVHRWAHKKYGKAAVLFPQIGKKNRDISSIVTEGRPLNLNFLQKASIILSL